MFLGSINIFLTLDKKYIEQIVINSLTDSIKKSHRANLK